MLERLDGGKQTRSVYRSSEQTKSCLSSWILNALEHMVVVFLHPKTAWTQSHSWVFYLRHLVPPETSVSLIVHELDLCSVLGWSQRPAELAQQLDINRIPLVVGPLVTSL